MTLGAQYPQVPGFKATRVETSINAADQVKREAPTVRYRCLEALRTRAMTADEVAEQLNISILTVRPRISELVKQKEIEATEIRRPNRSGVHAVVWRVIPGPGQIELPLGGVS